MISHIFKECYSTGHPHQLHSSKGFYTAGMGCRGLLEKKILQRMSYSSDKHTCGWRKTTRIIPVIMTVLGKHGKGVNATSGNTICLSQEPNSSPGRKGRGGITAHQLWLGAGGGSRGTSRAGHPVWDDEFHSCSMFWSPQQP